MGFGLKSYVQRMYKFLVVMYVGPCQCIIPWGL